MFVAHSAPSLPRLFYCKWSGLIGRREGGWGGGGGGGGGVEGGNIYFRRNHYNIKWSGWTVHNEINGLWAPFVSCKSSSRPLIKGIESEHSMTDLTL